MCDEIEAAFERALRRFVSGMKDGHGGVYVPGVKRLGRGVPDDHPRLVHCGGDRRLLALERREYRLQVLDDHVA